MMTVEELIKLLHKANPKSEVITYCAETGEMESVTGITFSESAEVKVEIMTND